MLELLQQLMMEKTTLHKSNNFLSEYFMLFLSTYRPKRWDESLVRPNLDYSSLFTDDTGSLPGLAVWQIDNFYPIPVEEGW